MKEHHFYEQEQFLFLFVCIFKNNSAGIVMMY